ncbi:GNAT family N-acetyltransferase [Aquimarina sp. 2201CG14-23]|uniref:GNAT family N-acetyltransferase n=1 Tax=Aquimarina mycalae TaxID=3040073 RepID=UPI002478035C|nr:GNAT family N-acetyltransferase [Aquimarina sp. 2201CG14-23]MDH7446556.1 GNAT family N-acetyltransferase [Aquimarina sp. 2201CG14-23]
MKKEQIDYFFELFEKGTIPKLFPKVYSSINKDTIQNPDYDQNLIDKADQVYSVFFIPDYLKPELNNEKFTVKTVSQFFKGYAIFLQGFSSADAYIKKRFRSNAKGIRRRIKRLESCFSITYKTYYGAIEEEMYTSLMDSLEKMLVKRFEQRNDVSQSLLRWDHYKNLYFSLINEKRASLFVVYEDGIPIVISLNHHFSGKLFSAISSYDIDYSKFSLGSVEIYKKLDWCIANDHQSYEMGMGDLSYKREWSNHIYNFEHQIIYPKKSFVGFVKGTIEYLKVQLKEFVYKTAYVRYKKYKAKRKENNEQAVLEPKVFPIEERRYDDSGTLVDYTIEPNTFLRKLVFDFLYTSIDHIANVKVVEISQEPKTYLILGQSKMQKITL